MGDGEIDFIKLLGFAGYIHEEEADILLLVAGNEEPFLAWLVRNQLTQVDFPICLAVKNIQGQNTPENKYLDLARLGWKKVVMLMSDYV